MEVSCRFCQATHHLEVTKQQVKKWQSGTLIQDAMPQLDADERELLISGMCVTCWDIVFDGPEE